VRDRAMINEAVDLLAVTVNKLTKLVNYVSEKYPDDEDIIRLKKNYNPKKISETLPTSELTAYSENKGEKMAFCLNKTKNTSTLIDLNTLTFVGIHELAHTMTKSIGHKQEFWQNFKFLLENAVKINIYKPVDYKKENQSYCGMTITDNPYYDI
jgi:plasmid maintenance system antidote protein VapI